jgi:chromosome segregation ATPase
MSTTTTSPATNFEDVYLAARAKGEPHSEAVRRAMHAFGGGRREHELGDRIARVRARWDREHDDERGPLRVGDDLDATEPPSEPDAFSAPEAEIRERIGQLQSERQRLSLDSLSDDKARCEVATIEKQIAEAQAELSRVDLARAEQQRREQAERDAEEQQAVAEALKLADELGAERAKAAKTADRAAHQLGLALAQLHDVSARQGQALVRAGQLDNVQRALPSDGDIAGAVAFALASTGAPSAWANLDVLPRFTKPLA